MSGGREPEQAAAPAPPPEPYVPAHESPAELTVKAVAIGIGFCGILLTGLVAAVGVQALQLARNLATRSGRN